jgi:chemotaxis protein MotA
MFAIIGFVVVIGSVIGGYLMHHGKLAILVQPSELVIIGGAALGTLFIANPMHIIKALFGGLMGVLKGSKFTKTFYLDSMKMMYELFSRARRDGLMALEADADEPDKSPVISKYPAFLKDHHVRDFVCDTLRMAAGGGVEPFEMDQMIERDTDAHHHEAMQPIGALSSVADSLPGLGIVAAVLGVVVTMGSLGGPPEEIGLKVAAALVGTFLGILMCYGMFAPLAANMTKIVDDESAYYGVLRVTMVAFLKGSAPISAVEIGRRAIPQHSRPSFQECEAHCKNKGGDGAAEAKAA